MSALVKLIPCLFLMATVALAASDRIQSPDAHWKTIKTSNYLIHYPANPKGGFEPFAMEVASKIEGIHAKVAEWVGFEAKGPINVVIEDPMMEANGATIPQLNRPIVVLWKTPPDPDSSIGHYDNWIDLLVTHELAHLHHLMRPRDGSREKSRWFDSLSIGPITRKAPRLIIEGYATLIEGRITGSGRPHSAYRAAVIRQWALQGKIPNYGDASRTGGFRGGSMAYLMGSAYLEWLERQNSQEPDILKNFWKQLTSKNPSKKQRSYDDSFKATFGTSPKDSYDRWRAEVTHDAIAMERDFKASGSIREGELIARFDTEITGLALSPDGSKLMARLLTEKKPGVRIWDINAKPEPKKKKASKTEKPENPENPDPNEVEDRKPEFTEPKILAIIGRRNGALPRRAWWTGNDQVTYEIRIRNSEGGLKPIFKVADLKTRTLKPAEKPVVTKDNEFTWKDIDGIWNIVKKTPDGQEQQLTRVLSAAWQPAPTPDGRALYYVQLTATGCEIRKLDLTQPALEPTPPAGALGNLMVQGAVMSQPNTPSLLPPPVDTVIQATDYSVFDTHTIGLREAYSLSHSGRSLQFGLGGSDILNRLDWYAVAAFGSAIGPRGGAFGIVYHGWRFAPSLQAFSSLEKPSYQKYEPISGFDRERTGAEFALRWQQLGMSPIIVRPFVAWESIKNVDADTDAARTNRSLLGATAAFTTQRSKGEWGIGLNATLQGTFGRTSAVDLDVSSWQMARLQAGLRFITPMGLFRINAEEGRIQGDYSIFDAFHYGGQNTGLVSDSLDLNRIQQPAMPDYFLLGDRMRRVRAEYGLLVYLYFEKTAVWFSDEQSNGYQRIAGLEFRSDDLALSDMLNYLGIVPSLRIGLHRPLDVVRKPKTIFTVSIRFSF